MSTRLAAVPFPDRQPAGPMYRSIVAIDLEGSTTRTNPVKGELRWTMYELLGRALETATITENHLEQLTDRGDGVLVLVRPHDEVPKTVLLDRLVPQLATLLIEHNAAVSQPALRIRLRAVVHAGEVHSDGRGFYGGAIDLAIRLLDSASVKRTLKQTTAPLVLVVSEEIYSGIVTQGYVDAGSYRQLVRVHVANRQHRGWVHIPGADEEANTEEAIYRPARFPRTPALAVARERVERIVPAIIGTGSRLSARELSRGGRR